MHQCIKFILFWNDTLHVSDGLSIHHQEILLSACLLASRQTAEFDTQVHLVGFTVESVEDYCTCTRPLGGKNPDCRKCNTVVLW